MSDQQTINISIFDKEYHVSCQHDEIQALRDSGVIGVLLPGTPLAILSDHFDPARKMIANNLPIALATDCNPNCYTESMQLIQQLAVFRMGMTPAESLVASTIYAALAIGKTY